MVKGYNPVSMSEKEDLDDWLSESEDNIVIFTESEKTLCLKKSYFLNPHANDIYKACIIENHALMVKPTYSSKKNYRNIGFYLGKYQMIDNKSFIETLKTGRVFNLEKSGLEAGHPGLPKGMLSANFISQELLELSQIGLLKLTGKLTTTKIMTTYPKTHPPPGATFTVFGKNIKGEKKKYTNVKFPVVHDVQLGKKIAMEVYDNSGDTNIPHKEDVYFNELVSSALLDYSDIWYKGMNGYLRNGSKFFDSVVFPLYCKGWQGEQASLYEQPPDILFPGLTKEDLFDLIVKKYNPTKSHKEELALATKKELINVHFGFIMTEKPELGTCITNIKDRINRVDKCFLEFAPRSQGNKMVLYRGMTQQYHGISKIGDETLISSYMSLTSAKKVMYETGFWDEGKNCCFFVLTLDKGIPYINMVNNNKYAYEKEILLPRNLKIKLTSIEDSTQIINKPHKIFHMQVSLQTPDQFKIDTGCRVYDIVKISKNKDMKPPKISVPSPPKKSDKSLAVATPIMNINSELDPVIHKTKLPRCPKGSLRNKKTGLCESKTSKKPPTPPPKVSSSSSIDIFSSTPKVIKVKSKKTLKADTVKDVKDVKVLKGVKVVKDVKDVKNMIKLAVKANKKVSFVQDNPKRKNTKSFIRYSEYKKSKNMGEISKYGGNIGDIVNDYNKGYLKILDKSNSSIKLLKPTPTLPSKKIKKKTSKKKTTSKKTSSSVKSIRLNDALDNLITINGHGGFNTQKIEVPEWCQLMIPHAGGLEADYTTPDANKDKLYEEDLYKNKYFNYKEGWKLYLPGDMINNLRVSTFSDGATCNTINNLHTLQKPLSIKCKTGSTFDKICPLYCTKKTAPGTPGFDYIKYKGKKKIKIKACAPYKLSDLFNELKDKLNKLSEGEKKSISPQKDQPILLIPFTCNAKQGSRLNRFDNDDNKEHLTSIYHKLYDERI